MRFENSLKFQLNNSYVRRSRHFRNIAVYSKVLNIQLVKQFSEFKTFSKTRKRLYKIKVNYSNLHLVLRFSSNGLAACLILLSRTVIIATKEMLRPQKRLFWIEDTDLKMTLHVQKQIIIWRGHTCAVKWMCH